MKDRGLVIGLSVVVVLLGLVLVFFAFGTPQAPDATSAQGSGVEEPVATNAEGDDGHGTLGSTTETGEVPPPDPSSPLAIEIPGCVCHSDDPEIVEAHATYRMNQCFGCHAGGMPEMAGG